MNELTNEQKAKLLGWKYKFSGSRNEFRWYGPQGENCLSCPIITDAEFEFEKYLKSKPRSEIIKELESFGFKFEEKFPTSGD